MDIKPKSTFSLTLKLSSYNFSMGLLWFLSAKRPGFPMSKFKQNRKLTRVMIAFASLHQSLELTSNKNGFPQFEIQVANNWHCRTNKRQLWKHLWFLTTIQILIEKYLVNFQSFVDQREKMALISITIADARYFKFWRYQRRISK